MISKEIEGSNSNISFKKLWILLNDYNWQDYGGLFRTQGSAMLYLLFKIINTINRIGVSNMRDEIKNETI